MSFFFFFFPDRLLLFYISNFPRFVVVSLLSTRHHTPVSKKSTNPTYDPKDATFDFPIYASLADKLGVLELVVWDKDSVLRKYYLGEVALPLEDWFRDDNAYAFDDPHNKVGNAPAAFFFLFL